MSIPANAPRAILPRLDYSEFRRLEAGLVDPHRSPGKTEGEEIRQTAHRLCSILARLFSDQFDRTSLWSRIGTAFATACAKVSDDDLDRWCDLLLEHVGAEPGQAAACEPLTQLRQAWEARPAEWRYALLNHCRSHQYAVLTHGRARWEQVKAGRVEL